jgi:class 3 adenylate cyclase/tetratricopeptide (TPR) repeat protein
MPSELVAVLFTDLVGSTELASELGDLAADELRREHFAHLREAMAVTSGTEVKTIGDAMMATYASAADALAGAVALQEAVVRHNRRRHDTILSMRVGVSVGDATPDDDDWFGTPVVEAARLCALAAGNQILATELVGTLAGSRNHVELVPAGEVTLKGLPDPVRICEVRWDTPRAVPHLPLPPIAERALRNTLAGRGHELAMLDAAWTAVTTGQRRAVLVAGEPGVGKTRLVSEIAHHAADRGATVLWGRCVDELTVPFGPFIEALRRYLAAVDGSQLRRVVGPLGGELIRVLPEVAEHVPQLRPLLQTDAATERFRLFEAISELLCEISVDAPLLLVLDDVHWADHESLLLLRHLLRVDAPLRALVVATYRDTDVERTTPLMDTLADLRREPDIDRIHLQGLEPAEVIALLEHTAGHELDERGGQLAHHVHEQTGGNPFFIGEVLRHLAESGAIVRREGRWTSDLDAEQLGLDEGLREVIGRRLSRLSDDANQILAAASVIGVEFDVATLDAIDDLGRPAILQALDEAVHAAVVREVTDRRGAYTFAHALVRSVLHGELPTSRRVVLHWRAVEALAERRQHGTEVSADVLAFHATEGVLAGDPARAARFSLEAGEVAQRELAFESAVRHFEQGLSDLALASEPQLELRYDLELALAAARRDAGRLHEHDAAYAAAETARRLDDAVRLADAALVWSKGGSETQIGLVDPRYVALLDEALDRLPDDAHGLRAQLLMALAIHLYVAGDPDAERRSRLASEAVARARQAGDPVVLAQVLGRSGALANFFRWTPSLAVEQQGRYEESLALAEKHGGDPIDVLVAHQRLGALLLESGDIEGFRRHRRLAQQVSDSVRQARMQSYDRHMEADEAIFTGDLERGERLVEEGSRLGREAGAHDRNIAITIAAQILVLRWHQGRIGELIPLLDDMMQTSDPAWQGALALALAESGRLPEAEPHFAAMTENDFAGVTNEVSFRVVLGGLARIAPALAAPPGVVEALRSRVEAWSGHFTGVPSWMHMDCVDAVLAGCAEMLGEHDEADRLFTKAVELCERAGARPLLARSHLDRARVLAGRGDPSGAVEHGRLALDLGRAIGMDGPHGVATQAEAMLATLEQQRIDAP